MVIKTAKEVLKGTHMYSEYFDEATKDTIQECARIRSNISERSINIVIRRNDWQQLWLKAKEKTPSSVAKLNVSHYKAGIKSEVISHLHALKTLVALPRGISLGRWLYGMSVMLEKK